MLKRLTLPFLLLTCIANGQIFNRAEISADFEDISRQADFSYVLMNSDNLGLYKLDANGTFVDSVALQLFTSSSRPLPLSQASISQLPDSTMLVYGGYVVGCDVITETGSFVAHFDSDLNLLQSKVFIDSVKYFSQNPKLHRFGQNHFALAMHSGLIGFDSNLNQTYFQPWSGSYIRGSVAISHNLVLEVSQTSSNAANASYLHNVSTGAVGTAPQMDGYIFDINDTLFSRIDNATLYLHQKSDFQAIDSINISSTIGFSHVYVRFQPDVILFAENGRYAIVSVKNLQLLKADSLHTTTKFSGELSFKDSILAAAINVGRGTCHIESININKPKATIVDHLSLNVENTRIEIGNITEQAPSVRTVYSSNDWKLTIVNFSQDTIDELAIKYYTDINYYCLPYLTTIHKKNLNLKPLDTLIIELDSVGHANTIFGTDYTSWLNVAVVMANKNIVKSNGWVTGCKTAHNVNIKEHYFTKKDVKVFPNPTSGVLNFEFEEKIEGSIKIYDLTGKLFETIPLKKEKGETCKLNLSECPSGVYLVQLESEGMVLQKKVVKN